MDQRVLFKRDYNVDDNNDYILVKEFLICGDEEHKELVLKLINTTNENCKDLKFVVHQLDKDGKEIALSTFESRYMKSNAGKEFVPKKAMALKKECEDVVVELQFAAFQTAYYTKGEIVPFEENSKSHLIPGEDNRFVRNRFFNKPILIALLVVLSLVALTSFLYDSVNEFRIKTTKFLYDGLYYEILDQNNEVEVVGFDKKADISNLVIPTSVGEYRVAGIEDNAFSYESSIVNLTIYGNIYIGDSAFENCNSLTNINIQYVTNIGEKAFSSCDSLQSVTMNNLDYIGNGAFSECRSLTTAVISNKNKEVSIRPYIFSNCINLTTIEIEQQTTADSNLTNILSECYSVRNLTLNELDNSTISNLFGGTTALSDLALETIKIGKLNSVPSKLFANFEFLKKVTIGVVKNGKIDKEAFAYCPNLEEVVFETPITVIGEKAFAETGLKTFNFNGIQAIGAYAFSNSKIEKVNLTNSTISTIEKNAFSNCYQLKEVVLNNSLKEIKQYAFNNCNELARFEMSSGLNTIGEYAFENCISLSTINLPKSLKSIGKSSFHNCESLSYLEIPGSITSIPENAFSYCSSLDTLVINSGVQTINGSAFFGCTNLKSLEIPDTVTRLAEDCFNDCTEIEYLTIPFVGISAYTAKSFDSIFSNELMKLKEIHITNALSLADGLLSEHINLEKVTIEGTLITLPVNTFYGCHNLEEVNIPDTIQSIGADAFAECHKLRKITLPENLTKIGSNAFENCYSLWEIYNFSDIAVNAGEKNTQYGDIGEYTIAVYETLEDDKMLFHTVDDKYLFGHYNENTYLLDYTGEETDIELPMNFTMTGLTDPVVNYQIYSIVFRNNAITSIKIPEGVTKIGINAFKNCEELELVYLPASLTSVHETSFADCDSLYEVYNLTNTLVTPGSTELGNVALNALIVHTNANAKPLVKYIGNDNVEYRLNPNSSNGWILGFAQEGFSDSITVGSSIYYQNNNYTSFEMLNECFANESITTLTIGESLKTIPYRAFYQCTSLNKVTVKGTSLTKIDDYAFYGCSSLAEFDMTEATRLKTIGSNAFEGNTNLFKFTVPRYVESVESNAFYNCRNLTFIVNTSNLNITEGSSSNGYIAKYAFYVVKNKRDIVTVNYNDFIFAKKSNSWYVVGFDKELFDNNLISFPDSFTYNGSTISKYYVWKQLYDNNSYGYYDVYIPEGLLDFQGGVNIYVSTVYYKGSSIRWGTSGLGKYFGNVKFYSSCVHNNSTWTYVNSEISTEFTTLKDNILYDATCTTNGLNRKYCSCGYTEEHIIYAPGHTYGSNNQCINCTARRIPVTESVFNSALFSNDQNNPFTWANNYIKTPTLERYDTSTLTLNANRKMRVEITFSGYLDSHDTVEVLLNGYIDKIIYNNTLYSWPMYSFELSAGESLEIMFNKQSFDTSAYVNMSITIYYE